MAELLTAEVVAALLALATTVASFLFALYLKKYGDEKGMREEAEKQGDLLIGAARRMFALFDALYGANPKAKEPLHQAEVLLNKMEQAWNDAKVKTPEMEQIYDELLAVLAALGKAMA